MYPFRDCWEKVRELICSNPKNQSVYSSHNRHSIWDSWLESFRRIWSTTTTNSMLFLRRIYTTPWTSGIWLTAYWYSFRICWASPVSWASTPRTITSAFDSAWVCVAFMELPPFRLMQSGRYFIPAFCNGTQRELEQGNAPPNKICTLRQRHLHQPQRGGRCIVRNCEI